MNKTLTFLTGVATGALVSYFLLKDKFKTEMEEELKAMEEYFQEREQELQEEVIFEGMDEAVDQKSSYVDYVKRYSPNELVEERYHDRPNPIDDGYGVDDEDYHDEPDREIDDINEDYSDRPVEIIGEQDFSYGFQHYLKETIFYYEDDDLLVTEDDIVVTDERGTIGEALTMFGTEKDPDFVYVRNHKWSTDYIVERIVGETYLHPLPTPPEERGD